MHAPVRIPHHPQRTDHTCGPAALKMVLDGFVGLPFPEHRLAEVMGSDPEIGTRQRVMHRFADELGLRTFVRQTNTRIEDIRDAMRTGHVVIVCYWLPDERTDHYAVVTRVTKDTIFLHDPWEGPDTTLPVQTFDERWFADPAVPTRADRWMLAIEVPEA